MRTNFNSPKDSNIVINDLFSISDPDKFLNVNFELIIKSVSMMEDRKDVISTYKKLNNIFKFPTYFPGILSNITDVMNSKYAKIDYEKITKDCIFKRLVDIEKFEPYRESIYNKSKEIFKYTKKEYYFGWDFYFPTKPSIHDSVTYYLNEKIMKNDEIYYSDYFFIFDKIKLTPFGFDHFYDITDELTNIIEMKHKNATSLIMYYHNKFKKPNSRYSVVFEGQIAPLNNNKEDVDNSDKFVPFPCVYFYKILDFNNKIDSYYRIAENAVRVKMELPKVDEGWISETRLFKNIRKALKPLKVIHHANLKFLGRQHLDIFIPYLSTAIEYQGLQHSEPVDFFGGAEGYRQTVIRDERKSKLCNKNGVNLIYVEEGYILEDILLELENIRKNI